MATTESKDTISEVKKPVEAEPVKAGVDMTKATDSKLAAPLTTSKSASDLLPAVELVGKPALFETQPGVGTDLVADTRKGAAVTDALPTLKPEQVTQPEAVARLAPAALDASVDLVKDKLTNYTFLIGSPDTAALARTLGPMDQADRQALEAKYQEKFGVSLRDELKNQLGEGEKFATIEAMLNRKDGETNLAGNARIALTIMQDDPERGMRLLRSTIAPLNSAQSAEMQANFQKDYGKPLTGEIQAIQSERVNDNSKAILTTLLNGSDKITPEQIVDMAKKSVQSKDLQMFAGVIGGDLPANLQARAALNADPEFVNSMRNAFGTRSRGGFTENPIAADYLREGKVSLATILKADTAAILPYFQNAANTDMVFSNATAKERRDYITGKDLVQSGREPLTVPEQEAKRYYQFIEQSIQKSASGTRQDVLRDELLHGGKTLISGLAELHKDSTFGFGGGHNTNDLLNRVENMTQQEWNLLKNPTYMADLKESLKSYATEDEQKSVLALIDSKLNPSGAEQGKPVTFEQSQSVQRPLEQYIKDFTASGADNAAEATLHIEKMTAADAARYKSDPAFKSTVDNFVNQNLTESQSNIPAQLLANRMLEQITETGKPPVLSDLDKFIKDRAQKNDVLSADPAKEQLATIGKVEEIMKDPALMQRMQRVLGIQRGEQEGQVSTEDDLMYKTLTGALGSPQNFAYLLTDGKGQSYIGTKIALSGGLMGDWMVGKYPDLARLPEEDRSRIRESLPEAQKKVLDNVIAQNGNADLTDRLRSLVLDGGSYKDFKSDLSKLSAEQQTQLKADYTNKYGGQLDSDLFTSISTRDGLSDSQKEVLKNEIAQNGQPQLVDDLRSFVLGNDKKFSDFQSQLAGLTQPQKQELKSEYQKRYGGSLDNDYLAKVDSAHAEQYSRYLNSSNTDGMQSFFDRMNKFAPLSVGDGTSLSQERMLQVNEDVLKQFNANMEKLPPAVQEAMAEYYSKTYQNNLDSNEKYAHFVADVTLTAASVAAAIALAGPTGGLSLGALATREGAMMATKLVVAGATAGAITRPAMIAAMENGTFDYSADNLAREGMIGAIQGAMIAPIGLSGRGAEVIANTVATKTAEETLAQRTAVTAAEKVVAEPVIETKLATEIVENATPVIESKVVAANLEPLAPVETAVIKKTETVAEDLTVKPVSAAEATVVKPLEMETVAPIAETKVAETVAPIAETKVAETVAPVAETKVAETVAPVAETKVAETVAPIAETKVAETVAPIAETKVAETVAPIAETKVAETVAPVAENSVKDALAEQAAQRTALAERAAAERAAAERTAAERAVTERAAAERAAAERAAAERAAAERAAAERAAAERAAAERAAAERAAAEKAIVPPVAVRVATSEVLPKPESTEQSAPEQAALKPSQNLMDLATVRRGEGPWQSAERILATDGKPHSVAEVRALTRAIQATFKNDNNGNGDMGGLKVKYHFVTEANYEALVNAVQDENVKKLLMGLASQ